MRNRINANPTVSFWPRASIRHVHDWTAGSLCGFNRSMQHLISKYREEDVVYEAATEDLLHRN